MHSLFVVSLIFCILLTVTKVSDTARILAVFPTPSISHQVVFRPVTLELAKRGHEVVVVTTDPMFSKGKAPANFTEIDVHDISYGMWKKFVDASSGMMNDLPTHLKIAMEQLLIIFEKQLETADVQNLLKDESRKFDLLFIEACVRPALALSHILKVPTIQFSSFGALPGMFESMGAPTHISLYPLPLRQRIVNLTIWEKISEYYSYYSVEKMFVNLEEMENQELKRIFGSEMPSISELRNNIEMIFFNVYPLWDFNRPVPPNIVYLGGLHQKPLRPLPKELQSYIESSKNGVIYMSLGTNVKPSTLPKEKVRVMLKVFASLPYNVLWKWDQDELERRPSNVHISKWFPQSDLLQHPNIKLFITQGGLQSTDEAITAGVPLVGIPMLGDQWYNVELYRHHKIGVKVDIGTLTEDNFKNAIKTVLGDSSYRTNMVKLRTVMRDRPLPPLERAIWWTEYVLRHGGAKHLRSPAAGMSVVEYYELQLLAVLFIGICMLLLAVGIGIKLTIHLMSRSKVKTN